MLLFSMIVVQKLQKLFPQFVMAELDGVEIKQVTKLENSGFLNAQLK